MNYLLRTMGLLPFSSFIISCADRLGPEIEKGVKASTIDGTQLSALLLGEEQKLRKLGHKIEISWSHRKNTETSYQVWAELKVLDVPRLSKKFEWLAQKTPAEAFNHWLVRAENKDTKRLVARPE